MILIGGASVQGKRSENQDRFFARVSEDGTRAVGAVADGIGGLSDGAGAATEAVGAVEEFCAWLFESRRASPEELRQRVVALYQSANDSIVERAGSEARSGTTLVLAAVTEEYRVIANVGDSRAFRLHDGELTRITHDHSVVEELLRDGALTPEVAASSPYRNVLTRSLGDSDVPEVDIQIDPRRPDDAGSAIVLSSDGVHAVPGLLSAERFSGAVRNSEDMAALAEAICRAAVEAGSRDNATIVVSAFG